MSQKNFKKNFFQGFYRKQHCVTFGWCSQHALVFLITEEQLMPWRNQSCYQPRVSPARLGSFLQEAGYAVQLCQVCMHVASFLLGCLGPRTRIWHGRRILCDRLAHLDSLFLIVSPAFLIVSRKHNLLSLPPLQ